MDDPREHPEWFEADGITYKGTAERGRLYIRGKQQLQYAEEGVVSCPPITCTCQSRNTQVVAVMRESHHAWYERHCLDCGCVMPICGIWVSGQRRTPPTERRRCGSMPKAGRHRCHRHGGNLRRGVEHYRHKGAGYAAVLPIRLLESYQSLLRDPEWTANKHEAAVVYARMCEVLGRVDTNEAKKTWDKLGKAKRDLIDAQRAGDQGGVADAIARMVRLIDRGCGEQAAWAELTGLADLKSRLADREMKRLAVLNQLLTTEQVMALMASVASAIREEVPDLAVQARIGARIGRLMAVTHGNRQGNMAALPAVIDAESKPAEPAGGEQSPKIP